MGEILPPQERVIDRLEGQRQDEAIQRYQFQAEELDRWLARTRRSAAAILEAQETDADAEGRLACCQVSRASPPFLRLALSR